MKNKKKPNSLKATILSLGFTLLLVLGFRSSAMEAYQIPSGSMIPTLLIGDRVFVNKASYGLRVPFTDWKLLSNESHYLFRTEGPARGDIIVFRHPKTPDIHLIKRVVGIPGDVIEMKNKIVYVNGKAPEQKPLSKAERDEIFHSLSDYAQEFPQDQIQLYEQKYDHTTGTELIHSNVHYSEDFGPVTVPENQYFCMGDNRDNSSDSRFWGFVPFGNIEGRAFIVWLSFNADPAQERFAFHPERIGKLLR